MGNCMRNPRTVLDPFLVTGEDSHGVAIGQNQPLSSSPEVWATEVPLTEGQLRGKRDTFWETAPAYDGRREIWDALKAACEAVEEKDHELAQAILDGANISLPTGRLVEAYDELGNRYVLPKYCISRPANMVGANALPQRQDNAAKRETEESQEADSTTNLLEGASGSASAGAGPSSANRNSSSSSSRKKGTKRAAKSPIKLSPKSGRARHLASGSSASGSVPSGDPVVVKVRLSTLAKDLKMTLQASDRAIELKRRLEVEQEVEAGHITLLYSGRVLRDRTYIKSMDIPKGFIIQAIVT